MRANESLSRSEPVHLSGPLKPVEAEEYTVVIAEDNIPTLDKGPNQASYIDWDKKDTRVITCCIGEYNYPGERFETRQEAADAIRARYGRILEQNFVPGRAFFRVLRQGPRNGQR